jgi:hypothetical protein
VKTVTGRVGISATQDNTETSVFRVGSERSKDVLALFIGSSVSAGVGTNSVSNIPPFTAIFASIIGTDLSEWQSLLAFSTLQHSRG